MSAASFTTDESGQVLLVSVHNVIYPITEYVLHRVFDPYGYVEKIDILQSSQLLQAVVQFDSCQNAAWAKSQLQGRYIYDGCSQLDIQFYKSFGNEIAADLDFIKHELQRMIVITDRMQERIKTMNCSIQKYADAVSRSSQSAKLKVNSNTVHLKSSSVMSMSSAIVAPTQDLPPTSKSLDLTKSHVVPMKLLLKTSTKVAAPAKIFFPLAETKVSTTKEYAQTQVNLFFHLLSAFSGRMLSRIQCFEFGKLYPIVMTLNVMFDTNEYKMFDLMLVRNEKRVFGKALFVFDPGGVLRKRSRSSTLSVHMSQQSHGSSHGHSVVASRGSTSVIRNLTFSSSINSVCGSLLGISANFVTAGNHYSVLGIRVLQMHEYMGPSSKGSLGNIIGDNTIRRSTKSAGNSSHPENDNSMIFLDGNYYKVIDHMPLPSTDFTHLRSLQPSDTNCGSTMVANREPLIYVCQNLKAQPEASYASDFTLLYIAADAMPVQVTVITRFTTVIVMLLLLLFSNAVVGFLGSIAFWPVYFPLTMYIKRANIKRGSGKWLVRLNVIALIVSALAAVGSIANIAVNVESIFDLEDKVDLKGGILIQH